MNVLYIGNFLDFPGGWSNASKLWLKAINRAFPKTSAARYFRYSDRNSLASPLIDQMQRKFFDHYDVVIQNVLPPDMYKIDGAFNIGIFYTESNGLLGNGLNTWGTSLSEMDGAWVSTHREFDEANTYGLSNVALIPQSIDLEQINKVESGQFLEQRDVYRFYTIGVEGPRKNLPELLFAYVSSFTEYDNVELVVKISDSSYFDRCMAAISKMVPDRQPEIKIIRRTLTDTEMLKLHKDCNCYVSTSSEESLSRPLLTAAASSKPCLVPSGTSMCDLENVMTFATYNTPCMIANPPVPGVYTYRENWTKPNVQDLAEKMKQIYENKTLIANHSMSRYDYKAVSNQIRTYINENVKHL